MNLRKHRPLAASEAKGLRAGDSLTPGAPADPRTHPPGRQFAPHTAKSTLRVVSTFPHAASGLASPPTNVFGISVGHCVSFNRVLIQQRVTEYRLCAGPVFGAKVNQPAIRICPKELTSDTVEVTGDHPMS